MSERFFCDAPITGPLAELQGDEARHLAVMRIKIGDTVVLFDGSGAEFVARVQKLGKLSAELEILARREVSRELIIPVTLAVALPKGDRQKWLVEKATELGVTALIPLVTQRGVAQPTESARQRLRRTAIEASKQCGRNRLLEIGEPQPALTFFQTADAASMRLVAEPASSTIGSLHLLPQPIVAAIGPEGGFTAEEKAASAACGWQPISLGPAILRVETAAIAVASWAAAATLARPSTGRPVARPTG